MSLTFTTTKEQGGKANILVYSRSGIGKTTLCATAPNPVIISTESGLMSLDDHEIPVIIVKTVQDLHDAHTFLTTTKKGKSFTTVCLDSISDIAESCLTDLKRESRDGRAAYGALNDSISALIRMFRDMNCNVYFIAKIETYENDAGISCYRPSMPGKTLTNDLPFFFDVVLALRLKDEDDEDIDDDEKIRYLQTKPSLTWEAKDRSRQLNKFEPPDLGVIFSKIAKKKKKKKKRKK